jgi:hypothetical protein
MTDNNNNNLDNEPFVKLMLTLEEELLHIKEKSSQVALKKEDETILNIARMNVIESHVNNTILYVKTLENILDSDTYKTKIPDEQLTILKNEFTALNDILINAKEKIDSRHHFLLSFKN